MLPGAPKVTVILNLFKREVLTEQLDSLFSQTTASHISEVWVCVFSAPAQDYALKVVKESKYKNVRLVVSDFNFKFYGRFQVRRVIWLVGLVGLFCLCCVLDLTCVGRVGLVYLYY